MGNFDAAKVIQAAATSNLGVISLIVLVLAFLAWRFFQQSNDKVKLIAFAMMFLGAAGFVAAVTLAGGDSQEGAAGSAPLEAQAAASPRPEAPASPEASPAIPDIVGAWHDPDGYRFVVAQDGSVFTYRTFFGGQQVGGGAGTIAGTRLTYRFTDDAAGNEGTCEAELSADARRITGTCDDGSDEWDFTIRR